MSPGLCVAHVVPWSVPIFVHCPPVLKCILLTHFSQQDRLQEIESHGSILSLSHGEPPPHTALLDPDTGVLSFPMLTEVSLFSVSESIG